KLWNRMRCPQAFPDLLSNDLHPDVACAGHADGMSSATAEVDCAALDERTTIIDADDYRAAITGIRHSNSCAERQCSVRSGHGAWIELLARCCSMSRELLTVVSGNLSLRGTLKTGKRAQRHSKHPHCKCPPLNANR